MDLVCVTVDCADPGSLAAFWSSALGWPSPWVAPDGSGGTWPEGGPVTAEVPVGTAP